MKEKIRNYYLMDCPLAKYIFQRNRERRFLGFSEIKECPFKRFCERKDKGRYIYC
jgi:hypothetical protein